jgi:Uma2 family endonuclease
MASADLQTTSIALSAVQPPPLPLRRFSVAEYHQMGEAGVLTPSDRVELLEGWIVEKMNQKPAHGYMVGELDRWFHRQIHDNWAVRCQLPITLAESEPEPDIAVAKGNHADFRLSHPTGADCRLVIEVADSSLAKDRAKAAIYAAAGVQEYWIVNLIDLNVQQLTGPHSDAGYQQSKVLSGRDVVETQVGETVLRLELASLFEGLQSP